MAFGKPKTPLTPRQQAERNRRRAIGLTAAASAFKGGDPVGSVLGLQQQFEAQQQKAEQEELLKQFADDPRYADMVKLYRAGLDLSLIHI